ncbi:MAG: UDP-3-O-(3-hydroxymyristoyl)glucosamine N-acyltransferase [Rikenellaceae bacterium]|jgi:UDP-3-O-[3-hydroxymyristoyl] glucosamine N-acyltransferase|nr:UDP-3-O-(3-hydroxymyristoyl)glucosamine N-acyltransferase [Rikenellaceae bacterium]
MEFTAEMIAAFLGGTVEGNPQAKVWTVAKIEEGHEGALAFLSNPKYEHFIYDSRATIVMVNKDFSAQYPVSATLVRVEDAYAAFARLLDLYVANKPRKSGISPQSAVAPSATVGEGAYVGEFACISPGATIGKNAQIFPQVYVGDGVKIGDNATLYPGVKIYEECVLGDNVTIHAGTVIGGDGFGFAPQADGTYKKIPQIGNVVIEDWVEVGANTCIDRATMGSTVIRRGTKLDNLIQIGHNVQVGESTVVAAQAGIAGSTKVGARCMFGGQVGLAGHIMIADGVQVASQSGIANTVKKEGVRLMGAPAYDAREYQRAAIAFRSLPEMRLTLARVERELNELREKTE